MENSLKPSKPSADLYGKMLAAVLCLMFVIGIIAPRFMGLGPPLAGLVFMLVWRYLRGNWLVFSKPLILWLCAIMALAAASILWSVDPAVSAERTVKIFTLIAGGGALFFVCLDENTENARFLQRFLPWAFLVAGLIAIIELYAHGVIYSLFRPEEGKPGDLSFFNRASVLYTFCFFPVFAALQHSAENFQHRNALLVVLIGVFLAVLFKTDSQSAQLAATAGVLFYLFFPVRLPVFWTALAAGISVFILTAPWIAIWAFEHRPLNIHEIVWFHDSYTLHRLEIWDFVSRTALEKPFFGYGLESAQAIQNFDIKNIYYKGDAPLHPHNFILQIWLEFGLFGAALTAGFFSFILSQIRKFPSAPACMTLAVFMAAFTAATTSYGLWQSWWIGTFFLTASLCVITAKTIENKG